jgi:uncharacterized membrane protein
MRGMGFGKGMLGKGAMAKGGIAKGFFGMVGGFFKFLFFGVFFIILLIVGAVFFFAMRKKINQAQNFNAYQTNQKDDDVIDVEVVDSHPIKK